MSMDDLLKALHKDYLNSLPAKIAEIEQQIATEDGAELRETFHKLKGTGRTYGFPEISELGAVTENICTHNPAQSVPAGRLALAVLKDIHGAHTALKPIDLNQHPVFSELRKLLPN